MKRVLPEEVYNGLKKGYRVFQRYYNFGFKYNCPFCKAKLRRFLPRGIDLPVFKEKNIVGGGFRLNCVCPFCSSDYRERLIYLYLMKKTHIFYSKVKLLHIAPEFNLSNILSNQMNIEYISADLIMASVMLNMDICDVPFKDNFFDVIICNHVLEHVIDDRKSMSEIFRVLKPNGWAILQVPISLSLSRTYEDLTIRSPQERELAFGQSDHVRIYAYDYLDRLEQVGFLIEEFKWTKDFPEFGGENNTFGLLSEETLFIVKKPKM